MIVTILLWILFVMVDAKSRTGLEGRKNRHAAANLATLAGTILAIFTLMGTFFLALLAPRIH